MSWAYLRNPIDQDVSEYLDAPLYNVHHVNPADDAMKRFDGSNCFTAVSRRLVVPVTISPDLVRKGGILVTADELCDFGTVKQGCTYGYDFSISMSRGPLAAGAVHVAVAGIYGSYGEITTDNVQVYLHKYNEDAPYRLSLRCYSETPGLITGQVQVSSPTQEVNFEWKAVILPKAQYERWQRQIRSDKVREGQRLGRQKVRLLSSQLAPGGERFESLDLRFSHFTPASYIVDRSILPTISPTKSPHIASLRLQLPTTPPAWDSGSEYSWGSSAKVPRAPDGTPLDTAEKSSFDNAMVGLSARKLMEMPAVFDGEESLQHWQICGEDLFPDQEVLHRVLT
jgi:hypothetical protein